MRRWRNLAVAATVLSLPGCDDSDLASTARTSETTEAQRADTNAFCGEARGLQEDGLRLMGEEAQHAQAMRFTAMAKVAPPQIRDDVEVLRAMWVDADETNLVIVIGGDDAAENIRPYSEFRARHPKSDASGKRFVAYVGEECRVFL